MMAAILYTLSFLFIGWIVYSVFKKKPLQPQPPADAERSVLGQYVAFYRQLDAAGKAEFEARIRSFLEKVRIRGVDTEIEDRDKVFVAAAAIIPIFAFKGFEYRNIHDVLIYPSAFNHQFETSGKERNVLGMVGNGAMENQMILSLPELRNGFINKGTKSNAAIHEFVHLIDKEDGSTDGCPENLLPHAYSLPWLKRIHQETELIKKGRSDINPYAATSEAEFLAMASEYFFEQPQLMQRKHPGLYDALSRIFLPS